FSPPPQPSPPRGGSQTVKIYEVLASGRASCGESSDYVAWQARTIGTKGGGLHLRIRRRFPSPRPLPEGEGEKHLSERLPVISRGCLSQNSMEGSLMKRFVLSFAPACALVAVMAAAPANAGTPFVPGTGEFLEDCSDNFENPNWSYRYNFPKSSYEQDENQRSPGGMSN